MYNTYNEIEVFSVEEHKRGQQHVRRVRAQLLALPQVFFLHPGHYVFCNNKYVSGLYSVLFSNSFLIVQCASDFRCFKSIETFIYFLFYFTFRSYCILAQKKCNMTKDSNEMKMRILSKFHTTYLQFTKMPNKYSVEMNIKIENCMICLC